MAKAKEETAGLEQAGTNITGLKRDISGGVDRITQFVEERQAANEGIAAIKTDLAAKGIPIKALNMAMAYLNMDPDKREGFDIAYSIVREAIELPIDQGELFDRTETKTTTKGN